MSSNRANQMDFDLYHQLVANSTLLTKLDQKKQDNRRFNGLMIDHLKSIGPLYQTKETATQLKENLLDTIDPTIKRLKEDHEDVIKIKKIEKMILEKIDNKEITTRLGLYLTIENELYKLDRSEIIEAANEVKALGGMLSEDIQSQVQTVTQSPVSEFYSKLFNDVESGSELKSDSKSSESTISNSAIPSTDRARFTIDTPPGGLELKHDSESTALNSEKTGENTDTVCEGDARKRLPDAGLFAQSKSANSCEKHIAAKDAASACTRRSVP